MIGISGGNAVRFKLDLSAVRNIGLVVAFISLSACSTPEKNGVGGEPPKKLTKTEKAQLYVQEANGALGQGDPIAALEYLNKAEKLDDQLPDIYNSRALAFYYKKDLKQAVANAEKSVQVEPKFSAGQNTLGKLLMDLGRYDEARRALLLASGDPLFREAYKADTSLGIIDYRKGDYRSARLRLDRAIDQGGRQACVAFYYRGHLALREGHLDEALQDYRLSIKQTCVVFTEAHLAIGTTLERAGKYQEARKKYLEIQSLFPGTKTAEAAGARLRELP